MKNLVRVEELLNKQKDKVFALLVKYPAHIVAKKLGISERSLWYWLKKQGITRTQLQEKAIRKLEAEYKKEFRKSDLAKLPPVDFSEFLELDMIQKLQEKLATSNVGYDQKYSILRKLFHLTQGIIPAYPKYNKQPIRVYDPVHPSELFTPEGWRLIRRYVKAYTETGRDKNNLICTIRSICKWLEVQHPADFETSEYTGKFTNVRLDVEARYLYLKIAKELLDKREYELLLGASLFYFTTCARKESVLNAEVMGEITIEPSPEIAHVFNNETKFIWIKTYEKGKKGKKIEWDRLIYLDEWKYIEKFLKAIKLDVEFYIKRMKKKGKKITRVRSVTLERIGSLMLMVLRELNKRYPTLLNDQTKKYIFDLNKVFHLWRHAGAKDVLETMGYDKIALASELFGWEKYDNMKIYGRFRGLELLRMKAEKRPHKFLYNEWLERAKKEGLI